MKKFLFGGVVLVGLVGLLILATQLGCAGVSSSQTPPPSKTPAGVPVVEHVFILIDENHSYNDVIGNPAMPYLNSLASKYAVATQYYADTHPSLPNYFMLTTGDLVTNTDAFTGIVTADNVARAVTAAGKSWKIYAENLPSVGYTGGTIVPYDKNHNPFSYLSDVLYSSSQASSLVPFTQLATDMANGTLPDYAMIVPDMADDGHDCPNEASSCTDTETLANVDSWIQTNVGPLIASPQFGNSVLICTWDEAEDSDTTHGGGHIATILVGSLVKRGYQSTTLYQHQSTLRLTMELLGITDFPGAASTAPDMAEFFEGN
jgi:phosphatidylinositol-3-phosphatase